jgi:pyridoxamine 5'-phosphate oxidase
MNITQTEVTMRTRDPLQEITRERERARQLGDLNVDVCYLATVTATGQPEVRTISLREIGAFGCELLLNSTSPKWRQLAASGRVSLLMHWPTVQRQYRLRGGVAPMEPARVAYYWARKSYNSQLLEQYYDAFHPQSQPLPSHASLLREMEELRRRFPEQRGAPIPPSLVGVYLVAQEIETWHGSPTDLLHDRRLYRRSEAGWTVQILVP